MNWEKILSLGKKPALFEKGDGEMWSDPYIGEHIVFAHLEPEDGDGTRPLMAVQAECDFWISRLGRKVNFLDLGCGPGVYCRILASLGWKVLGMDSNQAAIGYAKELEGEENLGISYLSADFLEAPFPQGLDAVGLIYGTFNVLSRPQRESLISKVWNSLRPGGVFFFDFFLEEYLDRHRDIEEWYSSGREGFWSEDPHLVLPAIHEYENERALCKEYHVLGDKGVKTYRLWFQALDFDEIKGYFDADFWELEELGNLSGAPIGADHYWRGLWAVKKPRGDQNRENKAEEEKK